MSDAERFMSDAERFIEDYPGTHSAALLRRALYERREALDRVAELEARLGNLDEERLARALVTWWPPLGADPLECAAAIAKAYREDTDDRP